MTFTQSHERPSTWHRDNAELEHEFVQNPFNLEDHDCVCQWCDPDQQHTWGETCERCGSIQLLMEPLHTDCYIV